jgi:hypothetical protein
MVDHLKDSYLHKKCDLFYFSKHDFVIFNLIFTFFNNFGLLNEMYKLFLLKLIIFLSALSSPCKAEWKKITDAENVEIYLNFKEIRKNDGLIYFWQLNDYSQPLRKKISSIKIYIQVNCKKNKFNPLIFSYHIESMGLGKAEIKKNKEVKWISPKSNSKQKTIIRAACIASFRT